MKNIYQDDFSEDFSRDIYSSSTGKKDDSNLNELLNKPSAQKPVRPAKQAPPPIKRAVPVNKATPQQSNAPAQPVYPQGIYPQPVYFQPDPNQQPYPVYFAPVPGVPAYPQAVQTPEAPKPEQTFPPADNSPAGTRVLFQSDDFEKKDEPTEETSEFLQNFSPSSFDISEINLSSNKRAPAPIKKSTSFDVDEMEMGTYEFDIMTTGQNARSKSIYTPKQERESMRLKAENYIDRMLEEDDFDQEIEAEPATTAPTKPKLPSGNTIRYCILAVSVVAILISCASLLNEYRLHRENEKLMSNLSNLIITEASTEAQSSTKQTTTKKNGSSNKKTTVPSTLPLVERPLSVEEQWESLKSENPDVVFPENIQLRYAKLYAQNTDFVGYLHANGSQLDTPVVQGENDNEYVEKNFYGESTKYACPFVTYTNSIEPLDSNTVIFGHHMRDGSIFGTLDQYRTLDGYKKAPVISFNTLYKDYNFKVIATIITNINPKDDNGYVFTYYWTNLNNELNHTAYLNQLKQRSLYDTGVDVLPTDKLLTLSTCCKDFDDARLVVVARLVRPGESLEVDTSRAVVNENPRFPQAYYDKAGKKNPFANAYQWQIS